jgi:RNA polymerase sigma-70 factor, ECF subfamily
MAKDLVRPGQSGGASRFIDEARKGSNEASGTAIESVRCYLLLIAERELGRDLRTKAAPSDIVQETLLTACKQIHSFQGCTDAQFRAWLRAIMRNRILVLRRQFECPARRMEKEESLEDVGLGAKREDLFRSKDLPPIRDAINRERALILQQALARLSERDRLVLTWRHTEDCKFEEMGRRLDCSVVAARKAWLRALERLRKEMQLLRRDSSFGGNRGET